MNIPFSFQGIVVPVVRWRRKWSVNNLPLDQWTQHWFSVRRRLSKFVNFIFLQLSTGPHVAGCHGLHHTVWTMCNDTGNNKWKHDRKCMIQRSPRPVSMSSPTTVSPSLWAGVTWQRRGWKWRLVYHPSSAEPVGAICTDGGGLSQRGPALWSNGWGQTVTANREEQKL